MADAPDPPPLSSDSAPSAVPPNPTTPNPSVPPPQGRSGSGRLHALWTLIVRLIILGAGVSIGGLAGLLVAQVWPASQPSPPAVEITLRYGSQTLRRLRQLPRWWREDGVAQSGADDRPAGSTAEVQTPAVEPAPTAPAPEAPALSAADRDRLTADLAGLRQDLTNADTRLTELEEALDVTPNGTLADRLQRIDQRLALPTAPETGAEVPPGAAPDAASGAPGTASPAASNIARVPYQEPRFPLVRDRVVLPSVLLFEPDSSTLTAPGQQLLNSIVPDLRRYGLATLLVGSHTDGTMPPELAGQLTLQQALAVQRYLEPQLDESMTRWVPLGYGKTRPSTAGTTPADQQRNQRIEIGIVPGS